MNGIVAYLIDCESNLNKPRASHFQKIHKFGRGFQRRKRLFELLRCGFVRDDDHAVGP
jgi:hypothetical protein